MSAKVVEVVECGEEQVRERGGVDDEQLCAVCACGGMLLRSFT